MRKLGWQKIAESAFEYSQDEDGWIPALADWVECQAIARPLVGCDKTTLRSVLSTAGWAPPNVDIIITCDALADDVFIELSNRHDTYGGKGYPFNLNGQMLKMDGAGDSPYNFLLALSYINPKLKPPHAGARSGAHLLEALAYLGMVRFFGENTTDLKHISVNHHLGRPSMSGLPGAFHTSVDLIAKQIREGGGYKKRANRHTQRSGDGGVDLLIRRGFPDDMGAQSLILGACAAGQDWSSTKRFEAHPPSWFGKHFRDRFLATEAMSRFYVVPRQLPDDGWDEIARGAGMIVDRCRLSHVTYSSGDPLLSKCDAWVTSMVA